MSSDDDVDDVDEGGEAEAGGVPGSKGGSSKSLALRFQKKFLGMSVKSKGVAKSFIDDTSGMERDMGLIARLVFVVQCVYADKRVQMPSSINVVVNLLIQKYADPSSTHGRRTAGLHVRPGVQIHQRQQKGQKACQGLSCEQHSFMT